MITYKTYTHRGSRSENEDSLGVQAEAGRYCFVVADGLGGHTGGKYASERAVNTVLKVFSENYDEAFLDKCFTEAQRRVQEEQGIHKDRSDMKTTLVALAIDGKEAGWGHIGDSRLYRFHKNKVVERTKDHSVTQMLVDMGELRDKDIRGHQDRNRLLRVIGAPWGKKAYQLSRRTPVRKCQAFLLCTDGFWELIDEKAMRSYLKKAGSVEEWLELMVKEVMANGRDVDMDNNSAIAIWMED